MRGGDLPLSQTMPRHDLNMRLQQAQEDVLSAITEGPSSLERFQKNWAIIRADFEEESRRNGVDKELSHLAQCTSSIISTLAGSLLRLDSAENEQRTGLLRAIENRISKSIQRVRTDYSRRRFISFFLNVLVGRGGCRLSLVL